MGPFSPLGQQALFLAIFEPAKYKTRELYAGLADFYMLGTHY